MRIHKNKAAEKESADNQKHRFNPGYVVAALLVLGGIVLAIYPWIADYYYKNTENSIVISYEKEVDEIDDTEYAEMMADAEEYNKGLLNARVSLTGILTDDEEDFDDTYWKLLNLSSSGIMGFVEIPAIDVYLPVYHGTSNDVLQKGVGHIEGTSLPVGGVSTHTVIAGHSGLNSKKIFTDLTLMEKGDIFLFHIMDQTFAYRVTSISTVLPADTSKLTIENGKDLATLLTCTPYGVNTHRLLVTGERTEYTPELAAEARKADAADSDQTQTWLKASGIAVILFIVLITGYMVIERIKRRKTLKKNVPENVDNDSVNLEQQ